MHLVVNHVPLVPARQVLAQEASAVRAHRAVARLCLLWPHYEGILLACVDTVGTELQTPLRRRSILRRFLHALRDAAQRYIVDCDLRDAADVALRACCIETAALRVCADQAEWNMTNTAFRVWRQEHGGALQISLRHEPKNVIAARAQTLQTQITAARPALRRQRYARKR